MTSETAPMDREELQSRLAGLTGLESPTPEFLVWAEDGYSDAVATTYHGEPVYFVGNQRIFTQVDLEGLYGLIVVFGTPDHQSLGDVLQDHPWVQSEHARPRRITGG